MTGPGYANRRIEITSMARARMTPDERATVERTCRDRGLRVLLAYSLQQRAFVATVARGSRTERVVNAQPFEAWRLALELHDAPRIVSVLAPDNAA